MRNRILGIMIVAGTVAPGLAAGATVSLTITIQAAAIAQIPRASAVGTLAAMATPGEAADATGGVFRTLDLPGGVSVRFNEQRVEMRCDAIPASGSAAAAAASGLIDPSEQNRAVLTPDSDAGECRMVASFASF